MPKRRTPAFLAVAALALVSLAGCGESGSDSEDEIREVIETSFTTADPVQCEQITPEGLEQIAPALAEEDDPVAACKEQLDDAGSAESVEISEVEVDGSEATATVTPDGGSFAGTTVTLGFVDDGGWKWNSIDEAQIDDREAFFASIDERAAADAFGTAALRPPDAQCFADFVREQVPVDRLEAALVSGEPDYVFDAVRECLGGGSDFVAMLNLVENQFAAEEGVSKRQATCLAGLAAAAFKNATLEQYANDQRVKDRVAEALTQNALVCSRA